MILLALLLLLHPQTDTIRDFTDDDYRKILQDRSRTLFYSFSPEMPLSIEGLKEIQLAATDLNAHVVLLANPSVSEQELRSHEEISGLVPKIRFQKSAALRNAGIQLHYPSVIVANSGKAAGTVIPGFKSRGAYASLITDALRLDWKEEFFVAATIRPPQKMGQFFKPVYGTDYIFSGSARPNYVFNLRTSSTYPAVNSGDPGTSPDGEYLTILNASGLYWFQLTEVLSGKNKILLHDPGIRTYQSMGLLPETLVHRVLAAETLSIRPTGLLYRDYRSEKSAEGTSTIIPLAPWSRVCDGKVISIPMMSKTGMLVSGQHDQSLKVFRIGLHAKECEEVFDSKMVTGKADIDRDDRRITWVSRAINPQTQETVDAVFLADLHAGWTRPIYFGAADAALAFPAFQNPDQIVVYDTTGESLILLERTRVAKP